jgi:ABC-type iron transport system FetAB ATPase subunit
MSPLETQVKEHHLQLRRRLDSIKRIHRASGELEERLAELSAQEDGLVAQVRSLAREVGAIDAIILNPEMLPQAANA